MSKAIVFASLLALAGCSGGANLAEKHLSLIESGKSGEAQSQYCSREDNLRLVEISSYELQSESEIENGIEYVYAVESPNVENYLTIQVLDSDAFFDMAVTSRAQLNNALEESAEILGSQPELRPAPIRENFSRQDLCIFLPFEQFES